MVFTGKSTAHGALFGQAQALRAELMAQAITAGGDNFWLEKIKVNSEPALGPDVLAARGDAVGELQELLDDAAKDADFIASLGSVVDLVGRDPPPARAARYDQALGRRGDV